MQKVLKVATSVQKAVFDKVILSQIASGFWKNARPADHADSWKGVEIVVSTDLGAQGFDVPRNYNFVNPDFFRMNEGALMAAAQEVDPNITVKKLKKQLISLNQIVGSRLKELGGTVSKLPRGRKPSTTVTTKQDEVKTIVRKVPVNFVEETTEA